MHFAFLGWSITNMISLAIYIVSAFAFYKLAKLRCLNNAWLAFIPFFSLYIIGYIGDTLKYNTAPFNRYLSDIPLAYALPLLSIFSSVAYAIPLLGTLVSSLLSLLVYVGQVLVYLFVFQQYPFADSGGRSTADSVCNQRIPLLILLSLNDKTPYKTQNTERLRQMAEPFCIAMVEFLIHKICKLIGVQLFAHILRDFTENFLKLTALSLFSGAGIFPCYAAVQGISPFNGFNDLAQRDFIKRSSDLITALGTFKRTDDPRCHQLAQYL